jgi:hypothetical protein
LIVNVDETAVHAKMTRASLQVLCAQEAVTRAEETIEHFTLCCGVSASGRRTKPVFIIKNKFVTAEAALLGSRFNFGDYGLQYKPNGW